MSLSSEFRESLKSIDVEEILDLIIFRPLSFLFVKLIYNTNITPNQISVVAMIFGILAGIFYGLSSYVYSFYGALCFFICNVLDCADGQLARLKKNGTIVGRIVDGLIDYVSSFSVFFGIAVYLSIETQNPLYAIILTLLAGVSRAIQNMFFDNFRNLYLSYVYGKTTDTGSEIKEFTKTKEQLKRLKGRYIVKFLVNIYLWYSSIQKKSTKYSKLNITPQEYKRKNRLLLRMWSWIGSTTHLCVLILFTIIGRIDLYLILTITAGNVIFIILFFLQKRVLKKYEEKVI